jgi:hypothetical protein
MNKQLIKQVQQGTHCIEYSGNRKDYPKLKELLRVAASKDDDPVGAQRYYHIYGTSFWVGSESN